MTKNLPTEVAPALHEYITRVETAQPGLLNGVYLHGSIALGEYTPGRSDVDFIAATNRRCSPADIHALRGIHAALTEHYPNVQLEGSYVPVEELGRLPEAASPRPFIHDRQFHAAGQFDNNLVTWWVVQQRGITLLGPPAGQLGYAIDWNELVARTYENMNSYWANYARAPRWFTALPFDDGIEWAVLGVLRQFYTFRANDITSKRGAGLYALEHTPPRWHPLIRDALAIRARAPGSRRLHPVRAFTARAFLQYIIGRSNAERV